MGSALGIRRRAERTTSLSSRGVEREGPGFTLDVPVADANNPHLPAPLSHQGAYPRESRERSAQGMEAMLQLISAMEASGDECVSQGSYQVAAQHYARAISCGSGEAHRLQSHLHRLETETHAAQSLLKQHTEKLEGITGKVQRLTADVQQIRNQHTRRVDANVL